MSVVYLVYMSFALKEINLSFLYGNAVKMIVLGHISVIYDHTDFYMVFIEKCLIFNY